MEEGIEHDEMWENYQTMADNLLSLAANLPEPLQLKAMSDLRQRLPTDVPKPSLPQTSHSEESTPPRRKPGRPRKTSKDQKNSKVPSTPSTSMGQLVIRTRRQKHVEQHGEEEIIKNGYRSPMVALLRSRSQQDHDESGSSPRKITARAQQMQQKVEFGAENSSDDVETNCATTSPNCADKGNGCARPILSPTVNAVAPSRIVTLSHSGQIEAPLPTVTQCSSGRVVELSAKKSSTGTANNNPMVVMSKEQDLPVTILPSPQTQDSFTGLEKFPATSRPKDSGGAQVKDGGTSSNKRCINLSEFVEIVTAEAKRQGEYQANPSSKEKDSAQMQPSQVVIVCKAGAEASSAKVIKMEGMVCDGDSATSSNVCTVDSINNGKLTVKSERSEDDSVGTGVVRSYGNANSFKAELFDDRGVTETVVFDYDNSRSTGMPENTVTSGDENTIDVTSINDSNGGSGLLSLIQAAQVTQEKKKRGRRFKATATYQCPECPELMCNRDSLREHLKKLHKSEYKCEMCGRRFAFKHKYDAHREVHLSGNFHKCPHCANHVRGHDRLEKHINDCHPGLEIPEAPTIPLPTAQELPEILLTPLNPAAITGGTAPQDEHDSTAIQAQLLLSEQTQLTDVPIPDKSNLRKPKKKVSLHGKKSKKSSMAHKCHGCKQVFRSVKKLSIHQKDVHGRVPSICPICQRRFLYQASYDEHMDGHNNGLLKPCGIGDCLFYYKDVTEYQKHVDRIHSNAAPRPHVCPTCGKSFWELRYLSQHIRNHNKTKKYTCETCMFETYNVQSLRRHLINKHEMTIAHVCDLCGAKLRSKSTLQDHIKRHFNQKTAICQVCSKGFINRSQLAMHMRTHKRAEYMCSVCGKESKTRSKMINHMLIHAKLKPYACHVEYCNYHCRVKSNLFKHMERVHKVQHPDKFTNYRYVEQVDKFANLAAMEDASSSNRDQSSDLGLMQYMCGFHACNYQAPTEDAVAKHQLRVHTLLRDVMHVQSLDHNDETSFQFSELPLDGALGCTSDIPETFESVNIPVPVEEISEQAEAAHTLARLQSAMITKTDLDSVFQENEEGLVLNIKPDGEDDALQMETLQVLSIPEVTTPDREVQYIQMDHDTIQSLVSVPDGSGDTIQSLVSVPDGSGDNSVQYIQLENGTIQKIETSVVPEDGNSEPEVQYIHLDEQAQKVVEPKENPSSTMYIVRMENEGDESATLDTSYLEMFAKSNVINLEPGMILMNEQGSVVKIVD